MILQISVQGRTRVKPLTFCFLGTFFAHPYKATGLKFALDTALAMQLTVQRSCARFGKCLNSYMLLILKDSYWLVKKIKRNPKIC